MNILRKMTWDLKSSTIDLHGVLNFKLDINYWLQSENTYRVIFIQDQASWFVITGEDFTVNGFNTGGIEGNGQSWWDLFTTPEFPREDGDGRPVSLTLYRVNRGSIQNFKINSPPFWCNAIAESKDVLYQGIVCNATNVNPNFAGQKIPRIFLLGILRVGGEMALLSAALDNTINLYATPSKCSSLSDKHFIILQDDIVENVFLENIITQRPDPSIQPNMDNTIYFKTWTGSTDGVPPTGGGGGGGRVNNVTARNFFSDQVALPVQILQDNVGHPGDMPSKLRLSNLQFIDFTGTSNASQLVNLNCSAAAPCPNIRFESFQVHPPPDERPKFVCINVIGEQGLPGVLIMDHRHNALDVESEDCKEFNLNPIKRFSLEQLLNLFAPSSLKKSTFRKVSSNTIMKIAHTRYRRAELRPIKSEYHNAVTNPAALHPGQLIGLLRWLNSIH
ncbi:hypothetical protein Clacol_009047 [Clathrus columnatus]|uniref:galacturonan 1,4-alpha-galacturonidase n=1 Tax=Clathrus columnatus TaxID=1419009 RepID=A0AAV5ANP4_9AGAM|nr:hypothetical protein Clacol_009047 [Clathrus columnatus]